MRPAPGMAAPRATLPPPDPREEHPDGRDHRPEPTSDARVHGRGHLRGRDRASRHRDQEHPRPQGEPRGRLRAHRSRRGLDRRAPHRPVGERRRALQPRAEARRASSSSTATRSTSSWARPRPRASRSSRCGCTSTTAARRRCCSGSPRASRPGTAAGRSPSGTPGARPSAPWPTPDDGRPMRLARMIQAVDAHAAGEPGRVIVGGVLDVPGATMFEKMRHLAEHGDELRKADAPRAARLPGAVRERRPAADPSGRRRRLRDHGAGRVPGDVGHQHDLRGDGPARDRDAADDRADHGDRARGAGRADPDPGDVRGRQGHRRHVPQRAGVRDPPRQPRSRSRSWARSRSTSPTAACST